MASSCVLFTRAEVRTDMGGTHAENLRGRKCVWPVRFR